MRAAAYEGARKVQHEEQQARQRCVQVTRQQVAKQPEAEHETAQRSQQEEEYTRVPEQRPEARRMQLDQRLSARMLATDLRQGIFQERAVGEQ